MMNFIAGFLAGDFMMVSRDEIILLSQIAFDIIK